MGGLVVDSRRSKFHVADPIIVVSSIHTFCAGGDRRENIYIITGRELILHTAHEMTRKHVLTRENNLK